VINVEAYLYTTNLVKARQGIEYAQTAPAGQHVAISASGDGTRLDSDTISYSPVIDGLEILRFLLELPQVHVRYTIPYGITLLVSD